MRSRPPHRRPPSLFRAAAVRVVLAAADVGVAAQSIAAGLALGRLLEPGTVGPAWPALLPLLGLAWPAYAWAADLYPGYGRALHDELARTVRTGAAAAATFSVVTLLLGDAVPFGPVAMLLTITVSSVGAPFARAAAKFALRRAGLWGRPVVLLGTGPSAARVARYLFDHPGSGLHLVAAFGGAAAAQGRAAAALGDAAATLPDLEVLGTIDDAWAFLETAGIRHAIITSEAGVHVGYDEVLRRAERTLRFVQFIPDLPGVPASSARAAPIGATAGIEVRNQLASAAGRAAKRALDVAASTVALLLLGPLLLALAAWIRFDSRGGALYLSPRVGRYGRTFHCVKFRTMHVDAEARLERLLEQDAELRAEYETFHKLADDPRITRAGRWLRKASLDELPQLINVFRGDMSIVGPRPYLVRELDQMGPDRDLILLTRPGITGYWQVEGRNEVTFEARQAMEAAYVRNWSVWWDLEIIARTPLVLLARTGK